MLKRWLLKRSIKKHGVQKAVIIIRDGDGKHHISDGGTRFSIAKELDIELPVAIVESQVKMIKANDIKEI